MMLERKNYPKVVVDGEASIFLADVVRNGKLTQMSPAGVELECRHQLIEQLSRFKSNDGLYPDFELEFELPSPASNAHSVKSRCNVAYCRRLKQDAYQLGLKFKALEDSDEALIADYIFHSAAA